MQATRAPRAARPARDVGCASVARARGLLIAQVAGADGFPWGHLGRIAQPLRLARRVGVPDLGRRVTGCSAVGHAARGAAPRRLICGGRDRGPGDERYSTVFLVAHVGLVLAGFAGFSCRGAGRSLPLAGAVAQAPQPLDPALLRPASRAARRAGSTGPFWLRPRAHARDGRGLRASEIAPTSTCSSA